MPCSLATKPVCLFGIHVAAGAGSVTFSIGTAAAIAAGFGMRKLSEVTEIDSEGCRSRQQQSPSHFLAEKEIENEYIE